MSYEIGHKKNICDRCEEKPEKWKVPFIYCDKNDKSHQDIGRGYRQYYVCDDCKKSIERGLKEEGKTLWNERWVKIN